MDNTIPACLAHQISKKLYRQLLVAILQDHDVKSVLNTDPKEHFFDKIENPGDGSLVVWRHGLKFDNLYMDYTNDFARCISYIEDAIYCTARDMTKTDRNTHGYIVEFNA